MKLSWKKFNELAKEYNWTPIYKGIALKNLGKRQKNKFFRTCLRGKVFQSLIDEC